jgi:dUTP pyrophosphatase
VLNSEEIRSLIESSQLVTGYIDLEKQLQPSGFDFSLQEVHVFDGGGGVDFSNRERVIAETSSLEPDPDGWYRLKQGCYVIVYNEVVRMPLYLSAIARTRSTMLRNGAAIETAVWDPGYHGRSSSLLVVHNPNGIRLKKDARVAQLIFLSIDEVDEGYSGMYQRERIEQGE